jgi:hypothetical protein
MHDLLVWWGWVRLVKGLNRLWWGPCIPHIYEVLSLSNLWEGKNAEKSELKGKGIL